MTTVDAVRAGTGDRRRGGAVPPRVAPRTRFSALRFAPQRCSRSAHARCHTHVSHAWCQDSAVTATLSLGDRNFPAPSQSYGTRCTCDLSFTERPYAVVTAPGHEVSRQVSGTDAHRGGETCGCAVWRPLLVYGRGFQPGVHVEIQATGGHQRPASWGSCGFGGSSCEAGWTLLGGKPHRRWL